MMTNNKEPEWHKWMHDHISFHDNKVILEITPDDIRTWDVSKTSKADRISQISKYVKQYFAELHKM